MDAPITLQRPRPQNLFVANPNTTSDLKCSTASLKPISGDFSSISLRSITSATLKKASFIDGEPKSATALGNYLPISFFYLSLHSSRVQRSNCCHLASKETNSQSSCSPSYRSPFWRRIRRKQSPFSWKLQFWN